MEVGLTGEGADTGVGKGDDEFGFEYVNFKVLGDITVICPLESAAQEKALARRPKTNSWQSRSRQEQAMLRQSA